MHVENPEGEEARETPKGGTGKTSEAMGCSKDLVAANLQLGLWVERDYLGQWVSSERGGEVGFLVYAVASLRATTNTPCVSEDTM